LTVVLFSVAAAIGVFVIAALVIGREARRLDAVAPRVVYEPDEAVAFVADALPTQTQARLTYDEVEKLLRAHLGWLHAKGLQPRNVIDRRQDIVDDVVISEETLTAWLLAEAERMKVALLDDVDAVRVVQAHLAYFEAIGAVGPRASA
jgi:uncharacterized protein (DUF2252 family)